MSRSDSTPNKGDPTKGTPVQQIYERINDMFGMGTNDIFQMEFPARVLEMGNYLYEGSDTINAQQVKPPAVAEAEFRLTNDMFDISNIVGGANGAKLAEQYREVVFSMLSSNNDEVTESERALRDDQDKIRAWLEEHVPNFDPPNTDILAGVPKNLGLRVAAPSKFDDHATVPDSIRAMRDSNLNSTISRVDLFQKLLDIYNSERLRWIQYKNDARPLDFTKQAEADAYDRLLTTYAPVIDAKLEALWTVLVVRGEYHRVRRYLGYIDIESASEVLQRAKENLRASVVRSIDDSEDVYPVVLTPANWAKHLNTNFQPEDLLNDTEIVRNQLFGAEKNRAALLRRRNAVLAGQQDITPLKAAEEKARNDLADAQKSMSDNYSDTTVRLIQLYFDAKVKGTTDPVAAIEALKEDDKVEKARTELTNVLETAAKSTMGITMFKPEDFIELCNLQKACLQNQAALSRASEAYTKAQLALTQAKSEDGSNLLAQLQDQIDSLTMDIDYYTKVLEQASNPTGFPITVIKGDGPPAEMRPTSDDNKPPKPEKITLPQMADSASIWQEIVLTYEKGASSSSTLSTAQVSHSNWNTGLWFWSAGGSSESNSGSSSNQHSTANTTVKVGMRVMKVTITRPWMNANVLANTKGFYRSSETKISKSKPFDVKSGLRKPGSSSASEDTILASTPTGFVVAKDVHIIFQDAAGFDNSWVENMQSSSNSGGGFLCFSASKSESSSEHRQGAVVTHYSDTLSIKIPAPQIIGWISELTPLDETKGMYKAFPAEEFATAATKPDNVRTMAMANDNVKDPIWMTVNAPDTPPKSPC